MLSQRRIARTTGVHRETVSRLYVRAARSGPVKTSHCARFHPAGCRAIQSRPSCSRSAAEQPPATPVPASEPASAPILSPGSAGPDLPQAGRQSQAAAWQDFILAKRQSGLSAKRIHQDLTAEFGAGHVSYDSVRRLLQAARCDTPAAVPERLECAPGAEAQIDFGTGAPIVMPDGKRRKTHVFRIVLSHSRKAYSEACFRQTTDDFLGCLENAFWHFGGVPRTLVIDNLKAAVTRADWFDPELNPKLQSFAQHYGTVILPTKPYTPRHKGKIERGIGYVKNNGLKGRTFTAAGGGEPALGGLGSHGGRHADPRHDQAASGAACSPRSNGAAAAARVAQRAVPFIPRGRSAK